MAPNVEDPPGAGPLLLLDGMSLAFRAFFALPADLSTGDGVVTNAVHGFTAMLVNLVRDHRPSAVAVAFDLEGGTFRDEMVEEYKGGRAETPPDLIPQFAMIRSLVESLAIPVVGAPGYEADDVLATLATEARDRDCDVIVVTGDRDAFQLVEDPYIRVLYNRRGVSDYALYDNAGIFERTGVEPARYPMLAALRGDPSDNLPGVPGVGEKTAAKLLTTYGDLDGIYANLEALTPKLRQNLVEHHQRVLANISVIPLVRDVPLEVAVDQLTLGGWDPELARATFAEFELRSLWRRVSMLLEAGSLGPPTAGSVWPLEDDSDGSGSEPKNAGGSGKDASAAAPNGAGTDAVANGQESSATGGSPLVRGASTPREAPQVSDIEIDVDCPEATEVATALGRLRTGPMMEVAAENASPLGVAGWWEGERGRSRLLGVMLVGRAGPGASAASEAEAGRDDGARVGGSESPWRGVWVGAAMLADRGGVAAAVLTEQLAGAVVGHEVKELLRSLLPLGVDCTGLVMDTAVAAYLLDPTTGDYSLGRLGGLGAAGGSAAAPGTGAPAQLELGGPGGAGGKVEGAGGKVDGTAGQAEGAGWETGAAGREALTAVQLFPVLTARLAAAGMLALHDDVERPLVRVLGRMEVKGIRVDALELRRIADELAAHAVSLEAEIHQLAGREVNVNSPTQLRTLLFEELGLPHGRKTKTGYSTDAATLEALRDAHPVVATLLRYRETEKLRSTYGESLLTEVAPDGRIHATFRQTVARTGRLSSERPNLHNIPVRTEAGKRFRRAFVPAEGASFLVADYDQIELRVLAHLSQDPGLLVAFDPDAGTDVHRAVAAGVYAVPAGEVTHTQRERAKMVSYGLSYGMEAYGLSRRLSISVDEAAEIIQRFFAAFPEVRDYMSATVDEARARGFTRTELGRRRPLPELSDTNRAVRSAAERQAMNSGIQGLAADLFKIALVKLDGALEAAGLSSRLVLQVHDEVLVEVTEGEEAQVAALTEETLVGAATLRVPLKVSMAFGASWAAAKDG